jgi:hypothetical protein
MSRRKKIFSLAAYYHLPYITMQNEPKSQSTCVLYCFLLLIFAFGLFAIGIGIHQLYFATASLSWLSCDGTVQHAETKQVGRRGSSYRPLIRYNYIVDGNRYVGDRYQYGGFGLSWQTANKIVAEYPGGIAVKVYYSPSLPQQSVLVPGRNWSSYLAIGLGTVFCLIGLLVFIPD